MKGDNMIEGIKSDRIWKFSVKKDKDNPTIWKLGAIGSTTLMCMSGEAKSGEKISGWTAEMFFPYALFKGIKNVPPTSGTVWKGNFYRIDHDLEQRVSWAWQPIESTFHDYKNFGEIIFE